MSDFHLVRFAASANPQPPRFIGTRYDAAGRFLEEPGNTVVCHLFPDSPEERALVGARARMMAMPDADRLTFTPVESLHMTLFQGIIEHRRAWPHWPREMESDAPIDAMTAYFIERLQDFQGCGAFRVIPVRLAPNGLIVEGATNEDRAVLQAWRDALSIPFGYRHPDHDSYVFHITFAYPVRWLDDARLPVWRALLDDCLEQIRQEAPVMTLRPPAFCQFRDMRFFEELLVLS